MSKPTSGLAPVPDHVPAALVRDFDFKVKASVPGETDLIAHVYGRLDRDGFPPIFWTPRHGGHWVVRSFDDCRELMRADWMSNFPMGIPNTADRPWRMKPIELDAPEHEKYRLLLSPLFTPKAVKALEDGVRRVAVEVIERFAAQGQCEFVRDFAMRMPTKVLFDMVGYPSTEDALDTFLPWVDQFFRGAQDEHQQAGAKILNYVQDFVAQRAEQPADDLISFLLHRATIVSEGDRRMTRQEGIDMSFQLFVASLDTVPSTFVTAWRFLATHPEAQDFLRAHPERIHEAAEEMLRMTGVVSTSRRVKADVRYKEVALKAGDPVLIPLSLANRDPLVFERPTEMVLDRESNQHLTFGAGPHRCLGSHFARTEVRIVMEEWMRRIPGFHIPSGAALQIDAGHTITINNLPLAWEGTP